MSQVLTDLQIKAQTAILDDRHTRKHGIDVLEDDGVITIKGTVPSRKVRRIAASILMELGEVVRVNNELKVQDDHEILERILR